MPAAVLDALAVAIAQNRQIAPALAKGSAGNELACVVLIADLADIRRTAIALDNRGVLIYRAGLGVNDSSAHSEETLAVG